MTPPLSWMSLKTLSLIGWILRYNTSFQVVSTCITILAHGWIDFFFAQYGSDVTDHSIFAKLTSHWEEEYHKDMDALNVSM